MNTLTATIKAELDRSFLHTYTETKNKDGDIVFTVNYPKIYDCTALVKAIDKLQENDNFGHQLNTEVFNFAS